MQVYSDLEDGILGDSKISSYGRHLAETVQKEDEQRKVHCNVKVLELAERGRCGETCGDPKFTSMNVADIH